MQKIFHRSAMGQTAEKLKQTMEDANRQPKT
jgi:hypothetical protein